MISKITLPSFKDFVGLIFPQLCVVCQEHLTSTGGQLCMTCQSLLPETDFHINPDNELLERFIGRADIESAFAMYYFTKEGRVQDLVHQLKYKGNGALGVRLGAMYGEILKETPVFKAIDCMIPVPLHPKRQRKRGYNQSEQIVKGLAQTTGKLWYNNALKRTLNTTTQTQKSRSDRFDNVKDAFEIIDSKKLEHQHILLVDDVITTGATLEACVLQLAKIEGIKVSFAAIGFASYI